VASDGWLGLSGRHGRRGARQNRGDAPIRMGARWKWLAAPGLQRGRATLRRPPAAVPSGSKSLRKILTMTPHGRRANSTVPPPCPALAGTVASEQSPIPSGKRWLSESPGGRRWPPEGGPASLEAMGGGVHDGIRALPDVIGLCPLATVPARAGHGGGTVELAAARAGASSEFYEGSPGRREVAGGLRRVARPLWRSWAAGCLTE